MGERDECGFILSDNVRRRMRQRGISLDHLERLWDFGALHHRSGGQVLYFDRAARRRLEHDGGESGAGGDDKAFVIYAVIDGAVVVMGRSPEQEPEAPLSLPGRCPPAPPAG